MKDMGSHLNTVNEESLKTGLKIHKGKPKFMKNIDTTDNIQIDGTETVSVSAQDGNIALGKTHTRSAPSLSSLPKVVLRTVPLFVWLNTDHSRP